MEAGVSEKPDLGAKSSNQESLKLVNDEKCVISSEVGVLKGVNEVELGDMVDINPSFMRVAINDKNMVLSPLVSYFDSSPKVSLAKEKSDEDEELNIESGPPSNEDQNFEEPSQSSHQVIMRSLTTSFRRWG
ncbi:hypothetical protein V6N13_125195 [Hibiscus sabdariffa]